MGIPGGYYSRESDESPREAIRTNFYDTSFRYEVKLSFFGKRILVDDVPVEVTREGDKLRIGCTTVTHEALLKLLRYFEIDAEKKRE